MTASPPRRLRFPRSRRLKQAREFARTRARGRRLSLGCLIVNWMALPEGSISRLGVVTSRKIGGAVDRSRSRRLLREVFRLHQFHLSQPVDLVLVARFAMPRYTFADVERDYLDALRKAKLWKETA